MSDRQTLSAAKLALSIRGLREKSPESALLASEPIAIVGIGCRFPGGANFNGENSPNISSAADYWRFLKAATNGITKIPADRWDADAYFDPDPQRPGKTNSRFGGFITGADQFDPLLFGIAPREAASMDPQQRLLLEVAWESLWDAGRSPESLAGSATGIFVAVYNSDYSRLLFEDPAAIGPNTSAGSSHSIASGRLSFLLDLRGPSISIDTACSSSLVAIHLACQSLRAGECNLALAGGVTLHLLPGHYIAMAKLGMLSPEGFCKTFDAAADGFVPGEGCGVIALRPLVDALRDNDHIHAVIRGTAVNQDGRTNVLTAPNGLAQQAVIRAALANAQLPPSAISYVEAHGTGTALGDPIEVEALNAVLNSRDTNPVAAAPLQNCVLGAVKSNFGHLEAAAGVAGLIKAALALEHQEIPPNLHFKKLNPHIELDANHFALANAVRPWPRSKSPRFAGVSSFGFGGTNAHIILEEAPLLAQPQVAQDPAWENFLLPISARTPAALHEFAARFQAFLHDPAAATQAHAPLSQIANSAATRRDHYEYRLATVTENKEQAAAALAQFLEGKRSPNLITQEKHATNSDIVFVCSGQGSQWPHMGISLLKRANTGRNDATNAFAETIHECDALIRRHTSWSLIDELSADEKNSKLEHTEYAQPAIFAIEIALARLWNSWGIQPAAIIGHSAGEVAAAQIAGALSLEEAIRIVVNRGRLMEPAKAKGKMLAVRLPADQVAQKIESIKNDVCIAAINSPESTVVSGDRALIDQLATHWRDINVACRLMPVDYAFHSPQMEFFSDELARVLGKVETRPSSISIMSTVRGALVPGEAFDARYWAQNMRLPVQFAAAIQAAHTTGAATFLEVGPHPVLLSYIEECLAGAIKPENLVLSLRRGRDEHQTLLLSLARLYTLGANVDWKAVYPEDRPPVSLPAYPYQRERFWVESKSNKSGTAKSTGTPAPATAAAPAAADAPIPSSPSLLGSRIFSPALQAEVFETQISPANFPYLADHDIDGSLLFPMAAFLELAASAASAAAVTAHSGGAAKYLTDISIESRLVVPEKSPVAVQIVIDGSHLRMFSHETSLSKSPRWTLHLTASLTAAAPHEKSISPREELRRHAGSGALIDPSDFYARLQNLGIRFGKSFRVLTSLFANPTATEAEAIAEIDLASREAADAGSYATHPALLDGCLQTILALLPPELAGSYLPVALDRFESLKPAGHRVWCRARLTSPVPTKADLKPLSANVEIFDQAGTLVARVEGLRLPRRSARSSAVRKLYRLRWLPAKRVAQSLTQSIVHSSHESAAPTRPQNWLIVSDNLPGAVKLAAAIRNLGSEATPLAPGTRLPAKNEIHGLAFLLDARPNTAAPSAPPENASHHCTEALALVHELLQNFPNHPPRFAIVSHNAVSAAPADPVDAFADSAVWGFMRTLALEHPELRPLSIDTDSLAADADFFSIAHELLTPHPPLSEIALRAGERLTPQLEHAPAPHPAPRRLALTTPGAPENLHIQSLDRRVPAPHELEVEVAATGLNFRDVLNVLGLHAEGAQSLGMEFCGRITRLGSEVTPSAAAHANQPHHLKLGDLVLGIAWGSFASHVTTSADRVARVPAHIPAHIAAGVPNAFLTAYHSLHEIAHLQRGEKILIHGATGGVGLAAVQLAKHAGAEIFATAGSETKRAYLRSLGIAHVYNSRTLDFAREIKQQTAGAGIDLVLNSLAGDFIEASLSVVARNGRFVEIGKTGVWDASRVAAFNNSIHYHVIDLAPVIEHDSPKIASHLHKLCQLFANGSIHPLPVTVFPFEEVSAAFSHMAHAKHIGKIVVAQPRPLHIRSDSTYLVTGGTGGIGLKLAQFLVDRGARHLVLVSRSGATKETASAIHKLTHTDARIESRALDIADAQKLAALLDEIKQKMPPLRGILHAAGTLHDTVISNQTAENFHSVFAAKALGAWNLQKLTATYALDFFVLFSSLASVTGSSGQSNYAAANAFLDALAHHRFRHGLAAQSINWGAWAEVGMAARTESQTHRRPIPGMRSMSVDQSLAALEEITQRDSAQLIAADVDWSQWKNPPAILASLATPQPAAAHAPELQTSTTHESADGTKATLPSIHDQLLAAPPSNRRALLIQYLREQALRVLGLSDSHFIDERQPLMKMGLDSLMAVEFRNHLVADLRRPLPTTLLFDHPTLSALATLLTPAAIPAATAAAPTHTPASSSAGSQTASDSDDTLLATIDSLSDAEAEELLKEELKRGS
jgi:acyl transferase domain-containing protein/NADPH-dependent curcumin reductase CurA